MISDAEVFGAGEVAGSGAFVDPFVGAAAFSASLLEGALPAVGCGVDRFGIVGMGAAGVDFGCWLGGDCLAAGGAVGVAEEAGGTAAAAAVPDGGAVDDCCLAPRWEKLNPWARISVPILPS